MLPLVVVCACKARPLVNRSDAGSVSSPTGFGTDGAAGAGGSTGGERADAGGAGGSGGGGAGGNGAAGAGGMAYCPRVDDVGVSTPTRTRPPPAPTAVGVSCQGMSPAYLFPPPDADVPGQYSRCASFDIGTATSVAVSPNGRDVALATTDGLVRMISIELHEEFAVLASPRAMIDLVAYEPRGRGVLTIARAQREVTYWRGTDFKPVWRITLPGTPYYHASGGGIAFAPDGASAVVSPGSDTFVLDVATGAIRAARANDWDAVLDVSYGWGGQRVVVAEPSLAAHCQHSPDGGKVTVLDASTLAPVATVVDLGQYGDPGASPRGLPAFRASPVDDLVLVSPRADDPPGVRAIKLSDGSALPSPPFTAMPAAFMPDGASVLIVDGGGLARVRLADGVTASVTMLGDGGPMGMSADGGVLAFGGAGSQLLRVLGPSDPVPATICSTDDPVATPRGPAPSSSLSRDGQVLALAAPGEVRIIRRADGSLMKRIPDGLTTDMAPKLTLSPLAGFVVTEPQSPPGAVSVFQLTGGRAGVFAGDSYGPSWVGFAFSAREDRVYSNGYRDGTYRLDAIDLGAGTSSAKPIPNFTSVIGTSNGCPVLYEGARGAWRSCGGCDDDAVGGGSQYNPIGAQGGVLSSDGIYVGTWSDVKDPGVKLWKLPPDPGKVATLMSRSGWRGWEPIEFAVAISPGATRVLTGAMPAGSCYFGPQFPTEVHDVGTGTIVDTLPPAPAATDGALRTVAYGAQLWCAR